MEFGLVVPYFNEDTSLADRFVEVSEFCKKFNGLAVFVDDGSTNNTTGFLEELRLESTIILSLPKNFGYGYANYSGAEKLKKMGIDKVAFIDSDGTNSLEKAYEMIKHLETYDWVKGSRYLVTASTKNVTLSRKLLAYFGNRTLNILFRTNSFDITNGFRAWRINSYLQIPHISNGFSSIVEEFYFARLLKFKVHQIPVTIGIRGKNQKKSAAKFNFEIFWSYLKPGLRFWTISWMKAGDKNLESRIRNEM